MEIRIDTDKIKVLADDAGNIILTPEAESSIIQLLEIQESIEEAIKLAKDNIEKQALKFNANFNSVASDNLRVGYRVFGSKYKIDESRIDSVPKGLYRTEVKYSVIPDEVDKYVDEHGSLPLGVEEPERKKQITITRKGENV